MGICQAKQRQATHKIPQKRKYAKQDIRQFYRFGKVLGSGSFGTVRIAYHLLEEANGQQSKLFAIKTINKENLGDQFQMIQRELDILQSLDHPNIIRFYETFEDSMFYHFVMEYCAGGELSDRIQRKGPLNERQCAIIMTKLLSAISYIHSQGIAHRDLKPENLLLMGEESMDVKIIDFGLSKKFEGKLKENQGQVGTPLYLAPEVLDGKHSLECDNWSLGCIMYILLCGSTPFYSNDKQMLAALIKHSPVKFEEYHWDSISQDAKDLIQKLLIKDPKKRVKASEALKCKWLIAQCPNNRKLERMISIKNQELGMQTIKQLQNYSASSRFKKETLKILLNQITENEIKEMRSKFEQLDEDGNGVISVDELQQVMEQMGCKESKQQIEALMKKIAAKEDTLTVIQPVHIKYTDFLAATLTSSKLLNRQRIWVLFKQFDIKNKGYIDMEDLRQSFQREGRDMNEEKIQEIIKEIDQNKDGRVDFSEFLQMMDIGDQLQEEDKQDNVEKEYHESEQLKVMKTKPSQSMNRSLSLKQKIQEQFIKGPISVPRSMKYSLNPISIKKY